MIVISLLGYIGYRYETEARGTTTFGGEDAGNGREDAQRLRAADQADWREDGTAAEPVDGEAVLGVRGQGQRRLSCQDVDARHSG